MYVGPWQEYKLMKALAEMKAENERLKQAQRLAAHTTQSSAASVSSPSMSTASSTAFYHSSAAQPHRSSRPPVGLLSGDVPHRVGSYRSSVQPLAPPTHRSVASSADLTNDGGSVRSAPPGFAPQRSSSLVGGQHPYPSMSQLLAASSSAARSGQQRPADVRGARGGGPCRIARPSSGTRRNSQSTAAGKTAGSGAQGALDAAARRDSMVLSQEELDERRRRRELLRDLYSAGEHGGEGGQRSPGEEGRPLASVAPGAGDEVLPTVARAPTQHFTTASVVGAITRGQPPQVPAAGNGLHEGRVQSPMLPFAAGGALGAIRWTDAQQSRANDGSRAGVSTSTTIVFSSGGGAQRSFDVAGPIAPPMAVGAAGRPRPAGGAALVGPAAAMAIAAPTPRQDPRSEGLMYVAATVVTRGDVAPPALTTSFTQPTSHGRGAVAVPPPGERRTADEGMLALGLGGDSPVKRREVVGGGGGLAFRFAAPDATMAGPNSATSSPAKFSRHYALPTGSPLSSRDASIGHSGGGRDVAELLAWARTLDDPTV